MAEELIVLEKVIEYVVMEKETSPEAIVTNLGEKGDKGDQGDIGPTGPQGPPGSGGTWGGITGLLSDQADLQAALTLKANNNQVVHLSGDETIAGIKSFSNNLIVDTNVLYVDTSSDRVGVGVVPTSKFHVRSDALGSAPTIATGLFLENSTTVSGAGAPQYSPLIVQRGSARKTNATAASQTVDFRQMLVPVDGAAAVTGTYQWGFSIDGAAFNVPMTLTSAGLLSVVSLGANGGIYSSSGFTNGNLYVGSASTGVALNAAGLLLGGAANTGLRTAFNGTTNYTIGSGQSYGAVVIGAMPATEASTGTHPILANFAVKAPAFTNAGGATTDAATVYIEGAPTGSVTPTNQNYALLVASGGTKLGGFVGIGSNFSAGAWLAITSGTTQTASINFSSGTLKTFASRGDLEYNSTNWFLTAGDNVRRNVATWLDSSPPVTPAGAVPVPTVYYGITGDIMLGEPIKWMETVVDGVSYASPLYNFG